MSKRSLAVKPKLPDVDLIEEGKWVTGEDIIVNDGGNKIIRVPKGTETDFASLPRVARLFFSTHKKVTVPSIVHDSMYQTRDFSRAYADKLFLRLMEAYGVGWIKRNLFYLGVRANLIAELKWRKR